MTTAAVACLCPENCRSAAQVIVWAVMALAVVVLWAGTGRDVLLLSQRTSQRNFQLPQ